MSERPTLKVYVTRGCASCRRAERTLRDCERVQRLVEIDVVELGSPGVVPPPFVIGGPAIVFRDVVVALGTPDCGDLAERLASMLARSG